MNKKFRISSALIASSVLALGACSDATSDAHSGDNNSTKISKSQDGTINVSASFYPVQWIVEQVGGEAVNVNSVTPANVEPHDFELAPADVNALSKSDAVFYVSGFQPALDDAIANVSGIKAIDLIDDVDLLEASAAEADGHSHSHDHDDDADHDDAADHDHAHSQDAHASDLDPHFWLDPERMGDAAEAVAEALSTIDSEHAADYKKRAEEVERDLDALDHQFEQGLAKCKRDHLVTSHAAFGYLTRNYGLVQSAITGIDPESEPAPAELAAVKDVVKETGTTTIFAEELLSPDIAQAVADETGATVEVLSPLESAPEKGDYIAAMQSNLEKIQKALDCA